jgi:hypothetical protein
VLCRKPIGPNLQKEYRKYYKNTERPFFFLRKTLSNYNDAVLSNWPT